MDRAREAGWSQEQTAGAVIELAYDYILRRYPDADADRPIVKAMARYRAN